MMESRFTSVADWQRLGFVWDALRLKEPSTTWGLVPPTRLLLRALITRTICQFLKLEIAKLRGSVGLLYRPWVIWSDLNRN